MLQKKVPVNCVGIDLADRTFVATILRPKTRCIATSGSFTRNADGLRGFLQWLRLHNVTVRSTVIAMETTGVLSQLVCDRLSSAGFQVTVIDAARIARTRRPSQPKSDGADSLLIADYLARHFDTIKTWQPLPPILAELDALMSFRELRVKMRTQVKNQGKARGKALLIPKGLIERDEILINLYTQDIKSIEREIRRLIKEDQRLYRMLQCLDSVPGVDLLLAANLLIATRGEVKNFNRRSLANYLGICPHEHSSGTSVRKKPRSSRLGSPRIRKLLNLAARTLVGHFAEFKAYYAQKLHEGKPKMLAINNLGNKLVAIMCAVIQNDTVYIKHYKPSPPALVGS